MICCIDGCTSTVDSRGMCKKHYRRSRNGTFTPRRDWSDHETAILCANYAAWGPSKLAELLPGRSVKAIKVKAGSLGIAKPRVVQERVSVDPHREVMVGTALRMWKGPVNREQPMRIAL